MHIWIHLFYSCLNVTKRQQHLHANKLPHIVVYQDECPIILKWFSATIIIPDVCDWDREKNTLQMLMLRHLFLFHSSEYAKNIAFAWVFCCCYFGIKLFLFSCIKRSSILWHQRSIPAGRRFIASFSEIKHQLLPLHQNPILKHSCRRTTNRFYDWF